MRLGVKEHVRCDRCKLEGEVRIEKEDKKTTTHLPVGWRAIGTNDKKMWHVCNMCYPKVEKFITEQPQEHLVDAKPF